MQDYHINLFYSDEDEGYIADIPDLQFKTIEEANKHREGKLKMPLHLEKKE